MITEFIPGIWAKCIYNAINIMKNLDLNKNGGLL